MTATFIRGPKDGAVLHRVPDRAMEMGKLYTENHASDVIQVVYLEPGKFPKARYELLNRQGDPVFYFTGFVNDEH